MSEQADRDALAEVLRPHQHAAYCIREGHIPNGGYSAHLAEIVLASDWLAQRDRRVAAEALREAAAQWASQYDEQTRDHGSRHAKSRAALRMASVLADQRADRIEAES